MYLLQSISCNKINPLLFLSLHSSNIVFHLKTAQNNGAMSTEPPKALVGIDKFLKFAENLDYLIIGGGTAGLAVAARLSEDPQINVGVLEAGSARLNDPNITVPLLFPALAGNPDYDWDYKTIKQV